MYYLKRVSGRDPVPVATSGPAGLHITCYVRMNAERLAAALEEFLDQVGEKVPDAPPTLA